jgi:hypothetical protein
MWGVRERFDHFFTGRLEQKGTTSRTCRFEVDDCFDVFCGGVLG